MIEPSPGRVRFPAPYRPRSALSAGSGSSTGSGSSLGSRGSAVGSDADGPLSRRQRASSLRTRPEAAEAFTPTRSIGSKDLLERYRHARGESSARSRAPSTSRRESIGPSRRVATARERLAEKAGRGLSTSKRLGNVSTERRLTGARGRIAAKGIGDLVTRDPVKAGRYLDRGRVVANATSLGISIGLGYGFGYPCYGYGGWGYYGYYGNPYWSWYWYRPYWNWYCSWWGYYPYGYCSTYWWRPYYSTYYYYHYSRPAYYASAIYEYESGGGYVEEEYVEEQPVAEAVGEGVVQGENAQLERLLGGGNTDTLARASNHYLTLGDSAFRDGRYGDAVHFYAKAVEFAPAEGVLYLVLADALFATGDFHYGAYALRKALELDPTLIDVEIDKHEFYTDPEDFDRQLATLEGYMNDHPSDSDARLLLAANYLAALRPAEAVALLESPGGSAVREDPAGALIYEAARNR